MELGKKIRQLRFKAGLTQEQLADRLGIGAQSVSKWENAVAMPDITTLPLLAEIFGVTVDDLFDLTAEQRLNRIENRLDTEKDLPRDVFVDFEEYLRSLLADGQHKKRATELSAYLWWHRMNSCAGNVSRFAREAVRMAPDEKVCQWMLQQAEKHAVWDWNIANHHKAIEFYREISDRNPGSVLPLEFLLDNLIADRRADEAEKALARLRALPGANPVLCEVYRAHIALARFDAAEADRIIADLLARYPDDNVCLFEAAQYHAGKCEYDKAIACYELSFEKSDRRPRFQDELQGIADILEIMGEYGEAAKTWDRIISLLRDEWGMTEETELQAAQAEKARLLALAQA